jgi:hypothetical protein
LGTCTSCSTCLLMCMCLLSDTCSCTKKNSACLPWFTQASMRCSRMNTCQGILPVSCAISPVHCAFLSRAGSCLRALVHSQRLIVSTCSFCTCLYSRASVNFLACTCSFAVPLCTCQSELACADLPVCTSFCALVNYALVLELTCSFTLVTAFLNDSALVVQWSF